MFWYRVIHRGGDIKDDSAEFIEFFSYTRTSLQVKQAFSFTKPLNKTFKDYIEDRTSNLTFRASYLRVLGLHCSLIFCG